MKKMSLLVLSVFSAGLLVWPSFIAHSAPFPVIQVAEASKNANQVVRGFLGTVAKDHIVVDGQRYQRPNNSKAVYEEDQMIMDDSPALVVGQFVQFKTNNNVVVGDITIFKPR